MNNKFFNKEDTLEERLENERISKRINEDNQIEKAIKKIDIDIKNHKETIKELENHKKILNIYKE